ncbi:hypothetical protein SAMN05421858_2410 [Haladaptatus litoreus]|uniref:Uncharacterized protein n=1 Tax=Haladaptatus litoreus TaxID=553468 RepID=A0A1N7B8N9_9EURY|nr:hypothetical protein [Haladaptatus litoreus]SIR47731.1 hypothetical protein SAMN05421858_2410 [Haladaptatus litoreus]
MSRNTNDTDWLWQSAMYITVGVVILTIGSGIASAAIVAFEIIGAILSLFIIGGSTLVGVYFVLRGLALFLGKIVDGERIDL